VVDGDCLLLGTFLGLIQGQVLQVKLAQYVVQFFHGDGYDFFCLGDEFLLQFFLTQLPAQRYFFLFLGDLGGPPTRFLLGTGSYATKGVVFGSPTRVATGMP
jgi:hypothetical protein